MNAVVAGSTGLIGSYLIELLESDEAFDRVVALSRREKASTETIQWVQADFKDQNALEQACKDADHAFCCLGTTMKKAKSKDAFREVDFTFVVNFARAAKDAGCGSFSVVSAIGSDASSGIFYNRVKGEMELNIEKIGFERLQIFQPSILMGPRREKRFGEKLGIIGMRIASPILLGSLKKFKPIHAKAVAEAMVELAKEGERGTFRYTYADMIKD
jgi:uncharacterized protein YbjT (DUF2867 family)